MNFNRKLVFIFIVLSVFTIAFYFFPSSESKTPKVVKKKVTEPLEVVYVTKEKAIKSQRVILDVLAETKVTRSEAESKNYIKRTALKSLQSPRFKVDVDSGVFITKDIISTPSDKDYISLLLNDDETTYFYEMRDSMQVLNIHENSSVDFIFRAFSSSVTKVIVNNVQVVNVVNRQGKDADNKRSLLGLVVILKVNDILKIKSAQSLGDVNVIKSPLTNNNLSFDGDSLMDSKKVYSSRKIKELRGE